MLKSNSFDYSYAYILAKTTMSVANTAEEKADVNYNSNI